MSTLYVYEGVARVRRFAFLVMDIVYVYVGAKHVRTFDFFHTGYDR